MTGVYLAIAAALALFTAFVFLSRKTIAAHSPAMAEHAESPLSALKSRWANLGAVAIFLYVGAEVCVISGMIFFLEQKQILDVPSQIAGFITPYFMLLAMVGRFAGSALLRKYAATGMLTLVASVASILCVIVIATYGMAASPLGGAIALGGVSIPITTGFIPAIAAITLGLFNSIMFPTIFTLTLERSSAPASATSGLMCMAICGGGGIISLVFGGMIDLLAHMVPMGARSLAFIVPLVCYLYVLWFALAARSAPTHAIEEDVAVGH